MDASLTEMVRDPEEELTLLLHEQFRELQALRAERDRLKEEAGRLRTRDDVFRQERRALAAENAGLRRWTPRLDLAGQMLLHVFDLYHGREGGSVELYLEECDEHPVLRMLRDEAPPEPLPLTNAVQRVLEAVGESRRLADALEDLGHPDDEDEYEEVAAAYEAAMNELDAPHDALQRLLGARCDEQEEAQGEG